MDTQAERGVSTEQVWMFWLASFAQVKKMKEEDGGCLKSYVNSVMNFT